MIIWGISAGSHDAALAVIKDKKIVFASHAERFSGIKNDPHLNAELIQYALQFGNPHSVVWYENPYLKTLRQLRAGQGWRWQENNIQQYLKHYGITAPVSFTSHHRSHAAAGYFTSNFTDATVLCVDAIGEFETLTVWEGRDNQLTQVYSQGYPHSLGLWYSSMTQRVGLKPNEDEYILMGMAAYGDPERFCQEIENDFFESAVGPRWKLRMNLHRGCSWWRPELTSQQDLFDIAAGTQRVYEKILLNIIDFCKTQYASENLVFMGGCALNCLANRLLSSSYNNVWIMPNPGDSGSAVGSVLAKHNLRVDWQTPYLGYNICRPYPITQALAELTTTGIVGIANGPAEFGPRALGNRSLLADPRGHRMKDAVNAIKQRQEFRPFAPVIRQCDVHEFFDVPEGFDSPYMQQVVRCKHPAAYPAIVHADGTSRVQTVNQDQHPALYQLLTQWHATTGCPMLLNTSLNIKGKPIVNSEEDAVAFEHRYGVRVY